MSAFTDYLENKLIDHILRDQAYAKPAAIYVGLFTTPSSDAAPGTEPTGGSYARAQVGPSLPAWTGTQGTAGAPPTGTGGAAVNAADVAFPAPTANWGVVTHFGIFDAASGGNMLFHGPLAVAKTINGGDSPPIFQAGALTVTLA